MKRLIAKASFTSAGFCYQRRQVLEEDNVRIKKAPPSARMS